MKGRDFIITGLQSWDIPIGSNAIDIAREISLHNRVLYVNSPIDMMTLLRDKKRQDPEHRMDVLKKRKPCLRQITESLWVLDFPFWVWSVNELPDGFLFDLFNRLNNKRTFRFVRRIADKLGFNEPLHFIDNDIYRSFYSKEILRPSLSIYYRRDNLLPFGYWKKHALRLEPLLIEKSDLVVCNSPQLAAFARKFNANSHDVGQGVDLSAYNTTQKFSIPDDLRSIPEPRIGYIGDINSLRLDPELLFNLARSRPGYSFVMIGNQDKTFASHEMHSLKNVFFPGSIPKKMVPAYMYSLQVCLNPQQVNEITIGNYPRKVDEYLALGKPVIATKTDTMELFREHCYLCSSLSEYLEAIDRSLSENSEEKERGRMLFAQSHSWKNNVDNIYRHIREELK